MTTEDHPPCSNPDCRYHGIAASNARENEFWQNHHRDYFFPNNIKDAG